MKKVIDGKEFTIEYGLTALVDSPECIEPIIKLIYLNEQKDIPLNKRFEPAMRDVSQITSLLFYAGLLEHHGEDGDKTVLSLNDAKSLLKKYFKENAEETTFIGLLAELVGQMDKDNFLALLGMGLEVDNETAQTRKKVVSKWRQK